MVFDPVCEEQRKQFFRQGYGAHLPGYTGHCPTLKFRVGKRFGASTEEIMKELLEKKILKTGPYRPNSGREVELSNSQDKEIKRDWNNDTKLYKAPPYILGYTDYHVSPERPPIVGYTGHIPGARGEVALSKGYAQAARKGLEGVQREREERHNRAKDMHAVQRVLDNAYFDDTGHTRA